jgi:hypothetical protein
MLTPIPAVSGKPINIKPEGHRTAMTSKSSRDGSASPAGTRTPGAGFTRRCDEKTAQRYIEAYEKLTAESLYNSSCIFTLNDIPIIG